MWILSADIGGTKLALGISSKEKPEHIIEQLEVASPQQSEALFEAMIDGFNKLIQNKEGEVAKVAVGLPGILDLQHGIVVHQQNLPWNQFPLVQRLQAVYPKAGIHMETDMMTAANGEYKIRHFEQETLIYLTISTGIACCTIHEGKFLRGAGIPGEVGFSLTKTGAYFEEQCAGPWLAKLLQEKTNRNHTTLQQFLQQYYEQDEEVVPIIQQWQQEIAQKIHSFILLLDPHVVVLGGGVMNHHPQIVKEIAALVDSYFGLPFFEHKKGRVQGSINKGNAGLIGAALL
ncbi:ROK family protein [Solibacillus silvestris]|uniref:ROK family protein n=1 Tax=Solibacillus silvestris TaxID=76853 RepID=UPI003F7D6DB6